MPRKCVITRHKHNAASGLKPTRCITFLEHSQSFSRKFVANDCWPCAEKQAADKTKSSLQTELWNRENSTSTSAMHKQFGYAFGEVTILLRITVTVSMTASKPLQLTNKLLKNVNVYFIR